MLFAILVHLTVSYSTAGFVNFTNNTSIGCGKPDAQAELTYTIYQMYMDEGNLDEDYFLATLASSAHKTTTKYT